MKLQQLIVTVKLLENDLKDFPVPTLPKVILEGTVVFIGDDVRPALEATHFLMDKMGISEDVTYLYNKICPHCDKKISEVKDSPHPQPCPFCREYFVIGKFSQLEKMEERSL